MARSASRREQIPWVVKNLLIRQDAKGRSVPDAAGGLWFVGFLGLCSFNVPRRGPLLSLIEGGPTRPPPTGARLGYLGTQDGGKETPCPRSFMHAQQFPITTLLRYELSVNPFSPEHTAHHAVDHPSHRKLRSDESWDWGKLADIHADKPRAVG